METVERSMVFPAIILIEDSQDDSELIRRTFIRAGIGNAIKAFSTGEAALECLTVNDLPVLLLLDLKLPGMDGLDVLRRLREDKRTRRLPVVVLTHSEEAADEVRSYELGVNAYVRKEELSERIVELARQLGLWLCFSPAPCTDERQS